MTRFGIPGEVMDDSEWQRMYRMGTIAFWTAGVLLIVGIPCAVTASPSWGEARKAPGHHRFLWVNSRSCETGEYDRLPMTQCAQPHTSLKP